MSDLREQIFAIEDIPSEVIEVPEWNDIKLEVRGMTGQGRSRFMETFTDPETGKVNYETMYPSLVIESVYDPESGEQVFNVDDLHNLNAKSGLALERLAGAAMRLSGMDKGAQERLGKDSETEKGASTLS